MKRRKEREFALKILYAVELNPIPFTEQIEQMDSHYKKNASDFSKRIIEICSSNKDELDSKIKSQLKNWDFNRVAIIDKILLRMALAEFLYIDSVPPGVTINEMIEVSKIYSTERSSRFINGILDAVLKKLSAENLIKKTGRGLISK